MSRRTVATDPATRARALQRASEVGAAQASRETGVPAGTLRAWQSRDRDQHAVSATTAVTGNDDQLERLKRIADKAAQTAESAIDRLQETVGQAKSPQSLAISVGVLLDKSAMLADGIRAIEEQQVRISEEQARQINELIRLLFAAVGVPLDGAVRTLLGKTLRSAVDGHRLSGGDLVFKVDPAYAEPARAEAEAVIERRLRPRLEREIREQLKAEASASREAEAESVPLELPERSSAPLDGSEAMVGPRQAVVTFSEPQERLQQPSDPDVEVIVDAEVVPDVPSQWMTAYHGDERLARQAWEQQLLRDGERAARDGERGDGGPFDRGGWAPSRHRLEGSPGGPLGRLD